ncbi:unnamed protein product [Rotaria sordida]|uniref:Xanthine dehydrogenase n=1 Tax=Rotaria sordida TaxID=392033 RepID=A0A815H9N9_9BILA|nr:unnamed protein product [Rotaria sordida]
MKELVQNSRNSLLFYVNGNEIIESNAEPDWTLLWYLRNKLNLTGSKLGCGAGGCGACTVHISHCTDRYSGKIEHYTANACLAPLCSVDGCHVITVEGLGSVKNSNIHPVQSRLAEMFGTQCGFCTPGIIMSLYETVSMDDNNESPIMQDIEEAFDGHLCRCTGYRSILDAAKTFATDVDKYISIRESSTSKITSTTFDKCISYSSSILEWYRPISLDELLSLRHSYPGSASKLVFGNTAVQIERKFKHIQHHRLISITHIDELQQLKRTPNSYIIGAGITFTRLQSKLYEWKKEVNSDGGICEALIDQLKHFASAQIRNVASFGGCIVNASPM